MEISKNKINTACSKLMETGNMIEMSCEKLHDYTKLQTKRV